MKYLGCLFSIEEGQILFSIKLIKLTFLKYDSSLTSDASVSHINLMKSYFYSLNV